MYFVIQIVPTNDNNKKNELYRYFTEHNGNSAAHPYIKYADTDPISFTEIKITNEFKIFNMDNKNEVNFLQTSVETWSEEKIKERNRYINGEFL